MMIKETGIQFQEYRYGWLQRGFTFLSVVILASLSSYAISLLIFNLTRWIISNAPAYTESSSIVRGSLALLFTAIVCSFMAAIFANMKPNVRASDKGLAIQNLLIW
jgi:hypothetical protein